MWKVQLTIDRDKDAASASALLYDINDELIFTYSRRVSLYQPADVDAFIAEAKAKSMEETTYNEKVAAQALEIENQLNK